MPAATDHPAAAQFIADRDHHRPLPHVAQLQRVAVAGVDVGAGLQRRRAEAELVLPAAGDHRQLKDEQLLEHKSPPSAFELHKLTSRLHGNAS